MQNYIASVLIQTPYPDQPSRSSNKSQDYIFAANNIFEARRFFRRTLLDKLRIICSFEEKDAKITLLGIIETKRPLKPEPTWWRKANPEWEPYQFEPPKTLEEVWAKYDEIICSKL